MTPCPAYWVLGGLGGAKDEHFFFLSKVMPIRVRFLPICLFFKTLKRFYRCKGVITFKAFLLKRANMQNIQNIFSLYRRMIAQDRSQKKYFKGWVGFQKYYVIFRVGHGRCLRLITRWVGGVKKGQKHAYVILEWSLT